MTSPNRWDIANKITALDRPDSNPPQENVAPAQVRLRLYQQGLPYREEKGTTEMVNHKKPSTL